MQGIVSNINTLCRVCFFGLTCFQLFSKAALRFKSISLPLLSHGDFLQATFAAATLKSVQAKGFF
jgi:hypothetical protein